jgi:hypothetical protein
MLQSTLYTNGNGSVKTAGSVKTVTAGPALKRLPPGETVRGRGLGHRELSKTARALLAADIAVGRIRISDFSERQLAFILGVSVPYIRAARALDDMQRIAVERGRRPLIVTPPRTSPSVREQLTHVVDRIGVDATLNLLAMNEWPAA